MRSTWPAIAGLCLGAFAFVLAGCAAGRGGGGLIPGAPAPALGLQPAASSLLAPGAGRDIGRREAGKPVRVAVALRYEDEAALRALVDEIADPASPRYRRYLSDEEFDARFAPTQEHYAAVARALEHAGFRVVATYPTRALLDVEAPAAVAERFFGTAIHDVDQGRYGIRYANVGAVRVPDAIAPFVRAVELSSLVYARPAVAGDDVAGDDGADADAAVAPDPGRTQNFIKNGGFEHRLKWWKACDLVELSNHHPYAGKYSALIGSHSRISGSVNGLHAMCQKVFVPRNGVLAAHLYSITNDASLQQGYQEVGLMSAPGKILTVLRKRNVNRLSWEYATWKLRKYEGQQVYVFFAVAGHGQKKLFNSMFVDAVTLYGTLPPTPTPSPSPSPTPSSSPTPTPTPKPTPTPTPVGPGPGKPLSGPSYGPSGGWAPRSVADGFDFPVQHGYNGTRGSVGIVMQSAVNSADLQRFLAYNQIPHGPAIVVHPIDGGPNGRDPHEGMLDVETIAGLAPGSKIYAYEAPDLSNVSILDAYQTALSQKPKPTAIDSPFAECEASDPAFVQASEADAIAGAALGITFVAASGDTGSACFNAGATTNQIGVEAPASNPHFLAVGGNESIAPQLAPRKPCVCPITNDRAWDDHNVSFGGLSGGGVSAAWPIPAYQQGVRGEFASRTQRNVPDVAFPAVDVDLFIVGSSTPVDGTSWSASVASALVAESAAICGRLGYVNPALYALYQKNGEGALLFDVTKGFNGGYTPSLAKGYKAHAQYDNVTGVGMPRGFEFALSLCGRQAAP